MSEDKDKNEDNRSTEDKIAESTGKDTEKFSQDLEDEADALIKEAYGNDEDDKGGDKSSDGDQGDSDEGDSEDTDDNSDADSEDGIEKKIDPEIANLLNKLDKSEKRVKDTRADHTRGRQELKEANEKTSELEDTVFKLKTQVEQLTNASTAKQEKKTEKAVAKTTGVLADQIKAMEAVDPDVAAAMKPIVENMFGQVDDLKEQLATEKQNAKDKAIEDANDAHFKKLDDACDGWEDIMQTKEFAGYLQALPPRAKRLALLDLNGGTAENIIEIFDDFKDQNEGEEDADTRKSEKLKKASSLSNPTNKKSKDINRGAKKMLYTRSQINAMSESEYARQEDDIDQAMANGLIENR